MNNPTPTNSRAAAVPSAAPTAAAPSHSALAVSATNGYMRLDAWILASIIQLATYDFCRRFLSREDDPCGRQFDQMTQAARSGQANIAEGLARGMTSKETEMKLLDVARASLAELNGDFTFWLMSRGLVPWARDSSAVAELFAIRLVTPHYGSDWTHESCRHILNQKRLFARWLEGDDGEAAANALLILILRCVNSLNHLLQQKLAEFSEKGGFREQLTSIRLQSREQPAADAPACPLCGKPMLKRLARRGVTAGQPFWSCSSYPACKGTRKITA